MRVQREIDSYKLISTRLTIAVIPVGNQQIKDGISTNNMLMTWPKLWGTPGPQVGAGWPPPEFRDMRRGVY
jgi:hypothetical protein